MTQMGTYTKIDSKIKDDFLLLTSVMCIIDLCICKSHPTINFIFEKKKDKYLLYLPSVLVWLLGNSKLAPGI
jgi:hypothetical protein